MSEKLVPNLEATQELLESLKRFQSDMDRLYGPRAISDIDSCLNGFASELENFISDEYQYRLKLEDEQRREFGHVRGEIICSDNGEIICGEVKFSQMIELSSDRTYAWYRKGELRDGGRGIGSLYMRFDGKVDLYANAKLQRTFNSFSSACLEIASEHPYVLKWKGYVQEDNNG